MPSCAEHVWLAIDPHEVRSFGRIRSALYSDHVSELLARGTAPELNEERQRALLRPAPKWADVTTTRGLAWLCRHGHAVRISGGYLRGPVGATSGEDPWLSLLLEAEQRLKGARVIWQVNPGYPGRRAPPVQRTQWVSDLRRLSDQLTAITRGLRRRARAVSGAYADRDDPTGPTPRPR